jgi:hypothetical protein
MAKCPFATWKPITGGDGSFSGGSFKIVHHTTEGSTAEGAMSAYKANRSDPHFTVDSTRIFQHIDTKFFARSLRNKSGGVETNRDSAIQIEVVGFAGKAKDKKTLNNVAKLCRWIEATHDVPRVWPNGLPKNGSKDPKGHNRNASNWNTKGGHFGHSQVPENDHWDPGYTEAEVKLIMGGSMELVSPLEGLPGEQEVIFSSDSSLVIIDITPHLNLITYSISLSLDKNGQGMMPIDIAWERVMAIIPHATKDESGNWQSHLAPIQK